MAVTEYSGFPPERLRLQGVSGDASAGLASGDGHAAQGPETRWRTRGRALLTTGIGAALALVILAPALLSSSDLLRWANSQDGLGLPVWWAWLAFVALDAAAVVCVGMVTLSAWRGEGGGMFEILTWLFAAGSAWANYRHGLTTPAGDDQFFFPAMSLAGPLLLHVTLSRVRKWYRVDAGRQVAARPRFGLRWLPGVAFRQTLRAWQASVREGLERPDLAVGHVQERDMLRRLPPRDQVHLAWQALGSSEPHAARAWLAARGVFVSQTDLAGAYDDLVQVAQGGVSVRAVESLGPGPRAVPSEVVGPPPGQSRGGDVRLGATDGPEVDPGRRRVDVPGAAVPGTDVNGSALDSSPAEMEAWQRRRLSVAVGLIQADPDLPLRELVAGLRTHGHDVTDRVAQRIYAEAVEFLRAEAPYAS